MSNSGAMGQPQQQHGPPPRHPFTNTALPISFQLHLLLSCVMTSLHFLIRGNIVNVWLPPCWIEDTQDSLPPPRLWWSTNPPFWQSFLHLAIWPKYHPTPSSLRIAQGSCDSPHQATNWLHVPVFRRAVAMWHSSKRSTVTHMEHWMISFIPRLFVTHNLAGSEKQNYMLIARMAWIKKRSTRKEGYRSTAHWRRSLNSLQNGELEVFGSLGFPLELYRQPWTHFYTTAV